jgi:hypothetical protein
MYLMKFQRPQATAANPNNSIKVGKFSLLTAAGTNLSQGLEGGSGNKHQTISYNYHHHHQHPCQFV